MQKQFYITILLIFSSTAVSKAYEDVFPENYAMIYDLANDWQVYDEKYQSYVPYIAERHKTPKTISVWLDLEKYKNYQLILAVQKESYLFINQNLCEYYKKDSWKVINMDSLRKQYKKDKIFLTLYDEKQQLPLKSIFIGLLLDEVVKNNKESVQNKTQLDRTPLIKKPKDFVIIIFLSLISFFAFLWNYNNKALLSFYSLRSSLSSLSRKDNLLISKPLTGINLLFLVFHAFCLSYFYVLSSFSLDYTTPQTIPVAPVTSQLLLSFSLYFSIYLGLLLLKLAGVFFFGILLGIEKETSQVHFFEYIRLSMNFYTAAIIFPVFIFVSEEYFLSSFFEYFKYVILIFHCLQVALVSFFVSKQVQYKNLYLFYYLCSTELTPLFIGIKILLF